LPTYVFSLNQSKEQKAKKQIEIRTAVGTILIPENMFKEREIKKVERVAISIGLAGITSATGTASDLKKYADASKIADYAVGNMATLVKEGIL
jgi:hypothetical protein